jgi:hypothetical protein
MSGAPRTPARGSYAAAAEMRASRDQVLAAGAGGRTDSHVAVLVEVSVS